MFIAYSMCGSGRLFRLIVLTVTVIHTAQLRLKASGNQQTFEGFLEQRASHPYLTKRYIKSRVECATKCYNDNACVAVSYLDDDGLCEMADESPTDSDHALTMDTGWVTFFKQGVCPEGWLRLYTSCYLLVTEQRAWFDAEVNCEEAGGYLAKIQTEEENSFLAETFATGDLSRFWVGGHAGEPGLWTWTDRSEVTFTDWYPGQPSSGSCLALVTHSSPHWKSRGCELIFNSVCEKHAL